MLQQNARTPGTTRYEDTIHQLFGNSSEIRGSFTPGEKFAESFQAVIELVKGKANVSTLCHESAHWLKALMEALCEMKDAEGNFLASEQLRGELDSINKWLDRQTYQEKEGTREREIEREEKFARAFEYYIQNGEPPSAGLEEVGGYYLDSLFEMSRGPMAFVESVKAKSAMMRHRAEYYDIDLRGSVNEFTDGKMKKVQRGFARAGYFAMRGLDAIVASVAWDAKYRRVIADLLKEGKELPEAESKALAEADDFVARTQGAARTLDLTPVQLSRWGRMLSPFITSAGALYNTLYRTAGRTVHGELTVPEAAGALLSNLVMPALLAGMARWLIAGGAAGGDDEETRLRASKAFMREVISSPFSGMPFVRDIVNKGTTMAIDRFYGGKRSYSGALFDAGALGALEEIGGAAFSGAGAMADGNWERGLWLWSDALGNAFQVPAITIYRKAKRVYENNGGELPEILEEFDNAVKPARGRRRE